MNTPRLIQRWHADRDFYLAVVRDIREWPATIVHPSPGFVVLTALDTRERSHSEVREFAGKLLEQGAGYTCSWGPDASRMDVSFDLEFIEMEERGSLPVGFVMTSELHESLDEALWFAIFVAYPSDVEATGVLAVTEPQWAAVMEARLRDPDQLSEDVLRDEEEA